MPVKMTPDEYMDVLLARQAAHIADHPPRRPGFPPLLEWFIRPGDEDLVNMNAIKAATTREDGPPSVKKPRTYRTAAHWRDQLARIDARLEAINGITRHGTTDPAAYGGIGVRQTARQQQRYWARIDRAAGEHTRLTARRVQVAAKLRRAEQREAT